MQKIDGNTQVLGLIGNPVRHTMSPAIHNFLSNCLEHNQVYLPFEVKDDVVTAVRGAYGLGIKGMNVTVPHKSAVMEAIVEIDPEAERIGAVNTLVRTEHGYKGYNTDVIGLRRELQEAGIALAGSDTIILGAGGAARAAAMMCAADGARNIIILNRNQEKAENLAEAVRQYLLQSNLTTQTSAATLGLDEYEKISGDGYIAFQCTSVGLYPNVDDVVIEAKDFYRKIKYAVDLIYTPSETRFMKLALAEGAKTLNGSKMLIYQAVASYELWNGSQISADVIQKLLDFLRKEGILV